MTESQIVKEAENSIMGWFGSTITTNTCYVSRQVFDWLWGLREKIKQAEENEL